MASKYIQKFPIPDGFPEVLHDLSKEILRYQPENIIEFCALYFKCLQEGKELDYQKKGKSIPCDFKNVIPGTKSSERKVPVDKSNYIEAIEKSKNISNLKSEDDKADPYVSPAKVVNKTEMGTQANVQAQLSDNINTNSNESEHSNEMEVKDNAVSHHDKGKSKNSTTSEGIRQISSQYVNDLMGSIPEK